MNDVNAPTLVTEDFSENLQNEDLVPFEIVGKVVNLNGTPNFSQVCFMIKPDVVVKPGEILGVIQQTDTNNFRVIAVQVQDCFENNPNEIPELASARDALGLHSGYAGESHSTRIFRVAKAVTIEEFELDEAYEVKEMHSPTALCRAGNFVVKMPSALVLASIGSLESKENGLYVGNLEGPDNPTVVMNPKMLQLGIALFGNPGRGKSYGAGVLMEEINSWDVPMLAIDVNGEMVDAARDLGGIVIELPDPTSFGLSLDLLTSRELVHIAPNVRDGTQYAEYIEIAHQNLKGKRGHKLDFDSLLEEIERVGKNLKGTNPSIQAAVKRIKALSNDPLLGDDFEFIGKLEKHRLVVLDCRYLTIGQTQLIAAAAARVLQKYGLQMAEKANRGDKLAAEWLSLLFIDEAHTVAPANDRVVSTQVLYELARMGRHSRTGLILSSQSPNDLDPSILKRLQTRFVFALEKDQLRSLTGIQSDLSDEVIEQLPKMSNGVCAVSGTSEVVNHGFLMKFRERTTTVGGSTPDVFASRTKKAVR